MNGTRYCKNKIEKCTNENIVEQKQPNELNAREMNDERMNDDKSECESDVESERSIDFEKHCNE